MAQQQLTLPIRTPRLAVRPWRESEFEAFDGLRGASGPNTNQMAQRCAGPPRVVCGRSGPHTAPGTRQLRL
jgi:hypothetical protein